MATHRRRSTKGTRSKTHPGRKNYTTKKGDKVFHRKGKYVRKSRKPYSKKRGGVGSALTAKVENSYNHRVEHPYKLGKYDPSKY